MSLLVGFDPGKSGGLIAIGDYSGELYRHLRIPLIGARTRQRVDGRAVKNWFKHIVDTSANRPALVYERVHSMPTDSVVSAFTFGKVTGQVIGIAEAMGFSMHEIAPRDWQRTMLRGQPRSTHALRKKSAALIASDLHPGLASVLRVKASWGLADAALIVEHQRRQLIKT